MDPGTRLGRYVVADTIREEPLGRVLLARVPDLGRMVYLCELRPPPSLPDPVRMRLLSLFDEEVRARATVEDPALPPLFDAGRCDDESRYVAYDSPLMLGAQILPPDPRVISPARWVEITLVLCRVLSRLSEAGVAVAPFHPGGVFLAPDGEVRYLHLTLAPLAGLVGITGAWTQARDCYPGPEPVGEPAAVFGVAAWLYAQLWGDPALTRSPSFWQGGAPPPVWSASPSVPSGVDEVLQRALSRDPAVRLTTFRAFEAALAGIARHMVSTPSAWPYATSRTISLAPANAWSAPAWAIGIGSLLGGAAGWWLAWR